MRGIILPILEDESECSPAACALLNASDEALDDNTNLDSKGRRDEYLPLQLYYCQQVFMNYCDSIPSSPVQHTSSYGTDTI